MSDQNPPSPPVRAPGRFKTVVAWVCGPIVLVQLIALIFGAAYFYGSGLNAKDGKRTYISMARLLVGGMEVNPKLGNGEPIPDSFYGTCAELIMSATVLQSAQMRVHSLHPDLAPHRVKIEAGRLPGTRILVLRMDSEDPAYAQAMLDAVMDEFMAMRRELRSNGQEGAVITIQDELVRLEKTMPLAEQKIKAAELSGASPEQLIEPKAALQRMKMSYERLIENLRRMDIPRADSEVFAILEHASPAVRIVPSFSFSNLFK